MEFKGECKYCGQINVIKMDNYEDDEARNVEATRICKCEEACRDRKLENAYDKIEELFLTKCEAFGLKVLAEEQVEVLYDVAKAVANELVLSVTLNFRNGIKATIKSNAKDELEIQRSDTQVMKFAVDDIEEGNK